MNQPEIVIVGAGAAGLGAAHYLSRENFTRIKILEASNRVGGRVHTVFFGSPSDRIVEMGANWIHGGVPANPLFTLASQGNLFPPEGPEILNRNVGYYYTSDNQLVDKEIGHKAWADYCEMDREASLLEGCDKNESLLSWMKNKMKEKLKEYPVQHRDLVNRIFNSTMYNYLSFHIGDGLEKVSLAEYGRFVELPGGDVKLPKGGFNAILRTLTKNFSEKIIHFGHEVILIEWDREKPKLTCANGTEFEPDHVILTIPLGYLKYNCATLFKPPLPAEKHKAIQDIGFGRVGKIFLEYDSPFWPQDFGNIRFAWTEEEMAQKDGTCDWVKSIVGFDSVVANPNVLVAWLHGDAVETMETLSDDKIASDCTNLLRQFTGNPLIPKPSRVLHTIWCHQVFTYGTYSYIPIHCSYSQIAYLASSLPDQDNPRVLFAGEATHPRFFSTVHGGLLSGVDAAKIVIQKYSGCS